MGLMLTLIAGLLMSCETEQTLEIRSPEPSFTLDTPGISNVFLNYGLPDNPAFSLTWNDNITGAAAYNVEMATEETFTTPISLGTTETKRFSMTVSDFNDAINNTGLTDFKDIPIYLRVKTGNTLSNKVLLLVTTYPVNPPVLTSPINGDIFILSLTNASDIISAIEWNDPVLNSVMNLTINYKIEAVAAGGDFTNSLILGTIDNTNAVTITHSDLNNIALSAGILPGNEGSLDLRIKAVITNDNGDELERLSETITITVTPYSLDFPYMYMVGDATSPGWNNNNNNTPIFRSQDIPNAYFFTGYFSAGAFKLIETKGQWQPQWGTNNGHSLAVNDGSGSDPNAFNVSVAGYYTYTFSSLSANASFTVESYDASTATAYTSIGLIGSATPGDWSVQTSLSRDINNPHLWFILDVTLTHGGEFLIRANNNWDDAIWRYSGANDLFGISLLTSNGDNFPFNGDTGSYDVWFNDLDGSYVIIPN